MRIIYIAVYGGKDTNNSSVGTIFGNSIVAYADIAWGAVKNIQLKSIASASTRAIACGNFDFILIRLIRAGIAAECSFIKG